MNFAIDAMKTSMGYLEGKEEKATCPKCGQTLRLTGCAYEEGSDEGVIVIRCDTCQKWTHLSHAKIPDWLEREKKA